MRKEKVLHARIPEQLDDELRRRSASLGLSVSTVVRNVLLHTFDLVEGIVIDSADIGRALRGDAPEPSLATAAASRARKGARPSTMSSPTGDAAGPLGWQELALNVNAVCEQCNALLARGQRAAVGVPLAPRPSFLCLECMATLAPATPAPATPAPAATGTDAPGKRSRATPRRRAAAASATGRRTKTRPRKE
jgi:hypothetical protein